MRRFAQLFAGRTDVYGIYIVTEQRGDGKQKGRGFTKQEPLTDAAWEAHLAGKNMLGVVPIRLDGTVGWFAGDIDVYNIDHQALIQRVQKLELPLVVCRSKSGGAHLYCFPSSPIPAELAIRLMRDWLIKLGHPKSEVFPKQEWVTEETVGNWINLPYFGGDKTDRFAYGLSGERLSVSEFEQLASAMSPTQIELEALDNEKNKKPKQSERDPLDGAPPCIQSFYRDQVTEGGRNNALAHVGIFLLKSDPDNWRDRLVEANFTIFDDPLKTDEVQQIARNVAKSKYEYLCNLEPQCSVCDKEVCMTRKWGVGPQRGIDYAQSDIDRIIKINSDPPLYYVIINGATVKMTTDQLLSPGKFRRRVYEVTGELMPPMKERAHEARIQGTKIDVEDAPVEVNQDGQVIEAFEQWCEVHCPVSRHLDEVLRGNPFYDREAHHIIFRSTDLIAAFKRSKKFNVADRDVWTALRDFGCRSVNKTIRGKQTKVWIYPVEKPWFEVPDSEQF